MRYLVFLFACILAAPAQADLVQFTFSGGTGGSEALGFVDTIDNTFTLTSYSRTDTNYRIPDTPLVFEAIAAGVSTSTPWDVPDSATPEDITLALDSTANMFLVTGNNSNHPWDMPANFGHTVGWGGGVFLRGTGSEVVANTMSNNFFRWAWGTNSNASITYSSVSGESVPEPKAYGVMAFLMGAAWYVRRRKRG